MARAFFGSHISDNIILLGPKEAPTGIACIAVPVARTGWQEYKVAELPQERAQDLGIDTSNQGAPIKLYRSPAEVFHPETIASFEAATVTDNHPPGMEFVTPKNFNDLTRGHVQNVRRGKEPLDNGEWPLLADIIINEKTLMEDVLNEVKREISCGYDYGIDRDGDTILQTSMIGNHVAVVPKGRAGPEARIADAAPEIVVAEEAQPEVAAVEEQAKDEPEPEPKPVTQPITPTVDPPKEKKPMKLSLKSIFGHGLRAAAQDKDVDPESLADAAQELSILTTKGSNGNNGTRARAADEGAHIDDPPEIEVPGNKLPDTRTGDRRSDDRRSDDRRADDSRARDRKRADDRGKKRSDDKRSDDHGRGDDGEPDEERERMHAALDKMMDAHDSRTQDADIAELRQLMDNYLQEEEHEPEHAAASEGDDTDPDLIPEEGDEYEGESDDADPEGDIEEEIEEEPVSVGDRHRAADARGKAGDSDKRRARDSRDEKTRAADASNGARQVLLTLKPLIAKARDSSPELVKAFNAQMRRANGSSFRAQDASYGRFGAAARARAADAGDSGVDPDIKKLQDYYSNAHGKKITAEVK